MKVVAFDTETRGLDWFNPDQQAFLATWADGDGEYCADLSDEAQVQQFRQALDEADAIVCHNLKFDVHMVRATLGFDPIEGKEIHDTDLLSRVVYPEGQRAGERGGHGLKNLAKVFLRADAGDPEEAIKQMAKEIGLRTIKQTGAYWDVWRAYPDVMEEYARQDARFTYDLYEKFSADVGDLKRVYDLELGVLPILLRAEQRGVKTDQAAVASLKEKFTAARQEVYDSLASELGEEALGGEGSTEALTEALLAIGVPLYQKTEAGKLATNKYALQEFEDKFPQIAELEEFRKLERFLSTYIGALEGQDVVHTSFRQCGAWTGRMSCTRPNLQNLPKRAGKEVRSALVPREGMAFVVCDYDSIEARLLAYYLNDRAYQDLIESGHDPHAWMATQLHGGRVTDYEKGSVGEDLRNSAKNTTYAITYGAGGKRVTQMNGLDPGPWWGPDHPAVVQAKEQGRDWPRAGWQYAEGRAFAAKIKRSLPNYYRLNSRIRKKIEAEGHVSTLFGRKQIVGRDKSYVGLNALVQGSAADIMKQGLINVDRLVTPLGATPLMVVHDEVVVECPIGHAEECLALVEQGMVSAAEIYPRLAVSGGFVTTNYADA